MRYTKQSTPMNNRKKAGLSCQPGRSPNGFFARTKALGKCGCLSTVGSVLSGIRRDQDGRPGGGRARTNVVAKVNQYPPLSSVSPHCRHQLRNYWWRSLRRSKRRQTDCSLLVSAATTGRKYLQSIPQKELQYTANDHEKSSHEVVYTNRSDSVPAGTPPSHKVAAERGERE